jgi:drug/metabolite transporter (DMT)-like permease
MSASGLLEWPVRHPWWGMAVGALSVSASAVLIHVSGTSPGTASFYRCVLALPFLAILAVARRQVEGRSPLRQRMVAWIAGALFAGDMLLWSQAIGEVGAGLSTVLVNTQVVLVPLLALIVDREPITGRFVGSLPVLLAGVALAGGLIGSGIGADPLLGTVHSVLAAVCYAGFLFLLRRGGVGTGTGSGSGAGQRIAGTMLDVTVSATVVSLVVGAVWHGVDLTPGWTAIGWLLVIALSSQVIGWLLVTAASPRLSSQAGAMLLLLTPVGAVALSTVVLRERPSAWQLTGCALVLASVQFATMRLATVRRRLTFPGCTVSGYGPGRLRSAKAAGETADRRFDGHLADDPGRARLVRRRPRGAARQRMG